MGIGSGVKTMLKILDLADYSKNNNKKNLDLLGKIHHETGKSYDEIAGSMDLYPVIIANNCDALNYRGELAQFAYIFGADSSKCYAEYGTFYSGIAQLEIQAGNAGISVTCDVCSLTAPEEAYSMYYDALGMMSDGLVKSYGYKFIYGQMGVYQP